MLVECEVLVIGAGAAGLSALREMHDAGVDALCVEARDRIGGRILTVIDPISPLPIELGAEFIHGRPPETWEVIRQRRIPVYDCDENAVHIVEGHVQQASDAWEQMDDITAEMKRVAASGADPVFSHFLKGTAFSDEAKRETTRYVEGFNAADRNIIGVASLALDAQAAESIEGNRNFRFANGYTDFISSFLSGKMAGQIRLSSIVEAVQWERDHAAVHVRSASTGQRSTITVRRLLITVPLGVLQAKDIAFSPTPERILQAAAALAFGQVMRVVMRFHEPWWEEREDLGDAGFWLSGEGYFPTWWTTLPMRSTLLTGWSAGPCATELIGQPQVAVVQAALDDLSRVTLVPRERLEEQLEAVYFHDWQADPFSRGAYSYTPAGAMNARRVLAEPVEDTIFFAGEATETEGHGATVHGAIASGRRAAKQILRSLTNNVD